jgi:fatty acid desaturase
MDQKKKFFAYTNYDIIPVICGVLHFAFVIWLFVAFPHLSWPARIFFGCLYAIAISWNINGISHNFIHNPYFNSEKLNYAFSLIESWAIGFSQVFYHWVHMRHHTGNSDKKDENGSTIDWLSIYRHSKDASAPESVLGYTFLSFFRDDLTEIYRDIKRKDSFRALFGKCEVFGFIALVLLALVIDWRAVLFLVPFYYIGNCLSSLNGYYEHFRSNPDVPIAWGVSSYNKLYNLIWFNNGYHAEHHFRPKMHWMRMKQFHEQIKEEQKKAGVHTITTCHALGFLAPENR